MRHSKSLVAVLGAHLLCASVLVLCSGCSVSQRDYYSEVVSQCSDRTPDLGKWLGPDPSTTYPSGTYLADACQKALESIIPYDDSFAKAPAGMKDRVTEAFQALIAYPIAIPDDGNKFLGTSPVNAGAIPLELIRELQNTRWKNLNQALFNFTLSMVNTISYDPDTNKGVGAYYVVGGTVRIYPNFWNPAIYTIDSYLAPFDRAALLVHEADHGVQSMMHNLCDPSKTDGTTGFECDDEFNGPYGAELAYYKYLLHGSAGLIDWMNLADIDQNICGTIQHQILNPYPQLQTLMQNMDCSSLNGTWAITLEGILQPSLVAVGISPAMLAQIKQKPRKNFSCATQ